MKKIGIIGLGYVGLPLLLRFSETGSSCIGFDIDNNKISSIKAGKSYINHINSDEIIEANKRDTDFTTDFSKIADVDYIIICVPTPLTSNREPDLSYITSTVA